MNGVVLLVGGLLLVAGIKLVLGWKLVGVIFCFYVAGGVFRKKKMDVPMRMTPNTP